MTLGVASNSRHSRSWSDRQLEQLKTLGGKMPVSELEEITGKTSGSLYRKAKELGIELNSFNGSANG